MRYDDFELLNYFCSEKYLGITIKSDYPYLLNVYEEFDDNYDYNDGEEGENGLVRYYSDNSELLCIKIKDGDDVSYEFTDLGVEVYKEELKQYLDWLLYRSHQI